MKVQKKEKGKELVFVYGTLKRSFAPHERLLKGKSVFLGEAETPPCFEMYGHAFPWLVPVDSGHSCHGELYEVDDLDDIDKYESVPTLYKRRKWPVRLFSGADLFEAWVYYRTKENKWAESSQKVQPNELGYLVWLS